MSLQNRFWRSVFRGIATVLALMAGLAFWVGGRAISEFAKTERLLAEMEGLALAAVLGVLAFFAHKTAAQIPPEENGTPSSDKETLEKKEF